MGPTRAPGEGQSGPSSPISSSLGRSTSTGETGAGYTRQQGATSRERERRHPRRGEPEPHLAPGLQVDFRDSTAPGTSARVLRGRQSQRRVPGGGFRHRGSHRHRRDRGPMPNPRPSWTRPSIRASISSSGILALTSSRRLNKNSTAHLSISYRRPEYGQRPRDGRANRVRADLALQLQPRSHSLVGRISRT